MKHMHFATIVIVVLIVLCVSHQVQAKDIILVLSVKGQVGVQHLGESSWAQVKEGMALQENDTVKTGKGAEAVIALDSSLKNIIKLQQDTELVLEELNANQDPIVIEHMDSDTTNAVLEYDRNSKLEMSRGKIFARIEGLPQGSSFEVRTPTAVAGVSGSGMSVAANSKTTEVGCFADKVFIVGINTDGTLMEKIVIFEGYKSNAAQYKNPIKPVKLTTAEQRQWDQFEEHVRRSIKVLRESDNPSSASAAYESTGSPVETSPADALEGQMEQLEKTQERLKRDLERVESEHNSRR